jgi:RHS repeat-associated protein
MRTVTAGGAVIKTYAYATASNRLLSETRPGATRTFAYDGAGNVTQDAQGGGAPTYDFVYNHANRMRQAKVNGVPSTDYLHDALGLRAAKQPAGAPASATRFLYDLDDWLMAETNAAGAATKEYIVLEGLPLALVANPGGTPTVLTFIHPDHLGAPSRATDGAKALTWDLQVGPFGELESVSGTLALNLRFPGQYHDVETATRENGWRTYDASLGRYLQSDPIGLAGGLNTYAYVNDNPVNRVDPNGLLRLSCGCSLGGNAFHDAVVDYLADLVDKTGGVVVTDVPIFSIVSTHSTVADLIVLPRNAQEPFIVEVKTGRYPTLTINQRILFPLLRAGEHAISLCPSLIPLGLVPGAKLPPLKIFITGAEYPGAPLWGDDLDNLQ